MPQQLELDLWQILAVAQNEPATVGFIELCGHLDGLNLVDGARADWGDYGDLSSSGGDNSNGNYSGLFTS